MHAIPLLKYVRGSAAVVGFFGAGAERIYAAGRLPDSPQAPYAVWQLVSGFPDNDLDEHATEDLVSIQIDVYAATFGESCAAANALRAALRPVAQDFSVNPSPPEPDTKLARSSFDVELYHSFD